MLFNFIKTSYSIELFLWMFGSFLIGYLFALVFYKKNNISEYNNQDINIEESTNNLTSENEQERTVIRARKTVDRGGIEIKQKNKKINFEAIGKASKKDKDDLTQIKGIGNFIEKKLNNIEIFTFEQISKISKKDIEAITNLIDFFPGRIVRDNWKSQAKELLENKK